jgi:hypothetical protein
VEQQQQQHRMPQQQQQQQPLRRLPAPRRRSEADPRQMPPRHSDDSSGSSSGSERASDQPNYVRMTPLEIFIAARWPDSSLDGIDEATQMMLARLDPSQMPSHGVWGDPIDRRTMETAPNDGATLEEVVSAYDRVRLAYTTAPRESTETHTHTCTCILCRGGWMREPRRGVHVLPL